MGAAALALIAAAPQHALAQDAMATPGKAESMVLLPKFLGILPFDEAHKGAEEAAKELKNPTPLQFLGPTPQNSVAGQIEIVTNATTQGVKAIMISNNSGEPTDSTPPTSHVTTCEPEQPPDSVVDSCSCSSS